MKSILDQLKKESKAILSDLGLIPKSGNVIGLDIGAKYFRAARLKEDIREIPLKDTMVKEVSYLKDLAGHMHISSDDKISVNLRGGEIAIKRVGLPFMPVGEIEEALRWELKGQLHNIDIDRSRIKFSILGEKQIEDGSKKIELIAIVYNESDIEARLKELRGFGLNVQAVIPTEFALVNYVNHLNLVSPEETVAIVDIGNSSTLITIVENKRMSFTRKVPIGGDTITASMTGTLMSDKGRIELSREKAEKIKIEQGISEDIRILSVMRPVLERLITQIRRSTEYYEHEFASQPVKKIILAGNAARLKGLRDYISKEMEAEVLDVLPEIAEAVGLVLGTGSDINMLPESFKEEKGRELKRISLRMVSIAFALISLFSYGFLLVKSANLKKELEIYRAHLETVQDIRTVRDKMVMLSSTLKTVSSGGIEAGKIMKEFSNIVVSSMTLDALVMKNTEPNLRLSGIVLKEGQLSKFMSLLESSPMFEKVQLVFSEKDEDYSSGALDFEIICNLTK